jgi:hypothetical protein
LMMLPLAPGLCGTRAWMPSGPTKHHFELTIDLLVNRRRLVRASPAGRNMLDASWIGQIWFVRS